MVKFTDEKLPDKQAGSPSLGGYINGGVTLRAQSDDWPSHEQLVMWAIMRGPQCPVKSLRRHSM
ncbi:hypothetical protein AVEN_199921-1, partial [Araneus ventricosus]